MSWAKDLEAVRESGLDFGSFTNRHRKRFRRWAGYFFERWPQRALDVDDLVQEGLLEAWSAIAKWDPSRGVPLARFVEYRVGERMSRELRRVSGWPKKSRGFAPVRPVTLTPGRLSMIARRDADGDRRRFDRIEIREATEGLADSLAREVVAGVSLGMGVVAVAAHLYADPTRRMQYEFDSQQHAALKIRTTIRRIVEEKGMSDGNSAT